MEPTEVFKTYWKFAAERQAIYFRRLCNLHEPLTNDPILASYRFTNPYRASDRVSQFLIKEVQYRIDRSQDPQELFFRTILFKIFNRIETWNILEQKLGPLTWSGGDLNEISKVFEELFIKGERAYSAAYIMPSPKFGHVRKYANHLALIKEMMDDKVYRKMAVTKDLKNVFEILIKYRGVGAFLAFQYSIDLNYSSFLNHDESSFVVAGPGALDGISKCFFNNKKYSPEEVIHWVCERQEREFINAEIKFQNLFGRRLQPIDCQNLFCEISKYARIAHPDFKGISGRTRIKQTYRKSPLPLPKPVFPPRWGLKTF